MKKLKNVSQALFVPFLLISAYFILVEVRRLSGLDSRALPGLDALFERFIALSSVRLSDGKIPIVHDTLQTSLAVTVSLIAVIFMSLGLAVWAFLSDWMSRFLMPMIKVLSTFTAIISMPLLMLIFGTGFLSKFLLVLLAVVPVMATQLYDQIKTIDETYNSKLASISLPISHEAFFVWMPLMAKHVFANAQSSLGLIWFVVIVTEGFAQKTGLGYQVSVAQKRGNGDTIIIYLFITLAVSWSLYAFLGYLRRRYDWSLNEK